jgi:hypothetical protein
MASGLDIAQKTFYIKIITRHLEGQVLTAVGLRSNFTKFSFCGKFSGVAFKGKGGFSLSEIFFCLTSTQMELIRNLLNLNNRNFGSIEKFRLVENRLKVHFHSRKFFTSLIKVENFQQNFFPMKNVCRPKSHFTNFSLRGKYC